MFPLSPKERNPRLQEMAKRCPEIFIAENFLFNRIHAGSHLFIGNNTRQAVNRGLADYTPHSTNELALSFKEQ